MSTKPTMERIKVWDLPTRLFHWSLVALITLQFASGEFGWLSMRWHFWLGYATLALIGFRVLWGFAGSDTSRFSSFLRGPVVTLRYLTDSVRGRESRRPGHNPLGGWSVILMLACVAVQAVTGLFTSDDILEEGPFTGYVSNATVGLMTRLHHFNRYALVILIGLHIGAVLLHWLLKNDDLVGPMVHGRARFEGARALRFASSWRALAFLVLSGILVCGVLAWAGAL